MNRVRPSTFLEAVEAVASRNSGTDMVIIFIRYCLLKANGTVSEEKTGRPGALPELNFI